MNYLRAQLERGITVAHHEGMDAAPSHIVSAVLGVIIVAAIFLWASFLFAPSWLDRWLY